MIICVFFILFGNFVFLPNQQDCVNQFNEAVTYHQEIYEARKNFGGWYLQQQYEYAETRLTFWQMAVIATDPYSEDRVWAYNECLRIWRQIE